ncbi:MAG: MgtC/SapB family protein [Mesorhizobium sp.]|nr:MgtC/SapB family protein [Mesorhizobium sp.]MBL8580184.1 MgtC/SapB family protein [Mesorhizobium sp.]
MTETYWGIWSDVPTHLIRLGLAFMFAVPIGWHRQRNERSAGLRTFPIVAIASCGFAILAIEILGRNSPEQARILAGLITGVGFLAGGTIIGFGSDVRGTATAASLWNVGIIGVAVGFAYYDLALVLSIANFGVLALITPLELKEHRELEVPAADRVEK